MEDMRMLKFETLIGDVNERLRKGTGFFPVALKMADSVGATMSGKSGLRSNYQM